MAAEAAVCRSVWDGAIPVRVVLDSKEVAVSCPPDALYLMVRRMSFLPLLLPALALHFHPFLPPGHDTVWLDFNGLPLKWNIWCGVLYDLLCPEQQLPWNLTVHFRSYPSDVLLPLDHPDTLPHTYMHALKQAVSVLQGSVKAIMQLSQADQSHLWAAVASGDLESFQRVLSLLNIPLFRPPLSISSSPSLRSLALQHATHPLSSSQAVSPASTSPPLPPVPMRLLLRRGVLPSTPPSTAAAPHHHRHRTAGAPTDAGAPAGGAGLVVEVGEVRSWRDVDMAMRVLPGGGAEHAGAQAGTAVEEVTIGAALAAALPQLASCFAQRPVHATAAPEQVPAAAQENAAGSAAAEAGPTVAERDAERGEEGSEREEQGGGREVVDDQPGQAVQPDAEGEGGPGAASAPGGAAASGGGDGSSSGGEVCSCVVVCQGVVIPPHTPLAWLAHNMLAPDLFLHICLLLP